MQNELQSNSKPLKSKTTKAERRALQEAQRSAKAATKGSTTIFIITYFLFFWVTAVIAQLINQSNFTFLFLFSLSKRINHLVFCICAFVIPRLSTIRNLFDSIFLRNILYSRLSIRPLLLDWSGLYSIAVSFTSLINIMLGIL